MVSGNSHQAAAAGPVRPPGAAAPSLAGGLVAEVG
jgi:hypothetical protein